MPDRIRIKPPLPTLIVPRGARRKLDLPQRSLEVEARGSSLTKAQIREIASTRGPVQAVLPWAVLSARRPYVKGKADVTFWRVGHVSGLGDEVTLAASWAPADAQVNLNLEIEPGQMFIAVFNLWCSGNGVVSYQTEHGGGDMQVTSGHHSFPIALTDTDDDVGMILRVKTPPTRLNLRSIEVWKVD